MKVVSADVLVKWFNRHEDQRVIEDVIKDDGFKIEVDHTMKLSPRTASTCVAAINYASVGEPDIDDLYPARRDAALKEVCRLMSECKQDNSPRLDRDVVTVRKLNNRIRKARCQTREARVERDIYKQLFDGANKEVARLLARKNR